MPIYAYSLKKYFKAKSTWIMLAIFSIITFLIIALSLTSAINLKTVSKNSYTTIVLSVYTGVATLFALFGAIYTGFTGARVFRDEIDDGTFLIVLSKPNTRARIIVEKWLAFATVVVIFVLAITIGYSLPIMIFNPALKDNANYVSDNFAEISMSKHLALSFVLVFLIGLVITFIFSSIALMISSKASFGVTIGITIAIGVIIPATSLVGSFTSKTTHSSNFVGNVNSLMTENDVENAFNISSNKLDKTKLKNSSGVVLEIPGTGQKVKPFIGNSWNAENLALYMTYSSIILAQYGFLDPGSTENGSNISLNGIYDLSFKEKDSASYTYFSFLDLNYQITRIGALVSSAFINNNIISESFQQANNSSSGRSGGSSPQISLKQKVVKTYSQDEVTKDLDNFEANIQAVQTSLINQIYKNFGENTTTQPQGSTFIKSEISFLNFLKYDEVYSLDSKTSKPPVTDSTQQINDIKQELGHLASEGKIQKVEYVDFLNKYAVLAVYITVAIGLIPLTYFLIRKQDFR